MDPNSGSLKRYTVEGAGNDGEDGAYITVDYVMAESETGAAEIVERARQKGDGWTASLSETFEDSHLARARALGPHGRDDARGNRGRVGRNEG